MTGCTQPGLPGAPQQRVRDPQARRHVAGATASLVAALAWLGLSWWHPTVTYHFGPPLAVLLWPVMLRARLQRRAVRAQALLAVCGGLVVALAAFGIAAAEHWLRGPTLIGHGSVPAEEAILTILAGLWGWRIAERRRRAWFLPAEPSQ